MPIKEFGNAPTEFYPCPDCGMRGLYHYGGTELISGQWIDQSASRCRYCGKQWPGFYVFLEARKKSEEDS